MGNIDSRSRKINDPNQTSSLAAERNLEQLLFEAGISERRNERITSRNLSENSLIDAPTRLSLYLSPPAALSRSKPSLKIFREDGNSEQTKIYRIFFNQLLKNW